MIEVNKNLQMQRNIYFVEVRNHPRIWDARKHLVTKAFKFESKDQQSKKFY